MKALACLFEAADFSMQGSLQESLLLQYICSLVRKGFVGDYMNHSKFIIIITEGFSIGLRAALERSHRIHVTARHGPPGRLVHLQGELVAMQLGRKHSGGRAAAAQLLC
jgi:hypothetical protein